MKLIRSIKSPEFYRAAMGGFCFWGVLIYYRMLPQSLVFIHIVFVLLLMLYLGAWFEKEFGGRFASSGRVELLLIIILALGLAPNYNVLFFYLLTPVYYPFPPPNHPYLRTISMFMALFAFLGLHFFHGRRILQSLAGAAEPRKAFARGLIGASIGLTAANIISSGSWGGAFFISLIFLAILFTGQKKRIIAGVSILIALVIYQVQPHLVYTGSAQNPVFLEQFDSPYARTHVYSYADGDCITIASNYHSITYNCLDPNRLPRGLRYLFDSLVGGREKYSAMVLGRTLGMYPNLLEQVNPNIDRLVVGEFDGSIAERVEQKYNAITTSPELLEKMEYFSGDLSRYLLTAEGGYDLLFYNGVGISQFQIPFALPYQEQFLFTPRVLNRVFDEVLTEHGALVIDWGGRSTKDQIHLIGNFPDDVEVRTFWYIMTEPPFAGNPLYYMLASRDKKLIERVDRHLARTTYFKDITPIKRLETIDLTVGQLLDMGWGILKLIFYYITPDTEYSSPYAITFSWDRPFMIHGLFSVQLVGLVALALLVFGLGYLLVVGRFILVTAGEAFKRSAEVWRLNRPQWRIGPAALWGINLLMIIMVLQIAVAVISPEAAEMLVYKYVLGLTFGLIVLIFMPNLLKNFRLFLKIAVAAAAGAGSGVVIGLKRLAVRKPDLFIFWPFRGWAAPWLAGVSSVAFFIHAAAEQSHQIAGYGYTWYGYVLIWAIAAAIGVSINPARTRSILKNLLLFLIVAMAIIYGMMDITGVPLAAVIGGLISGLALGKAIQCGGRDQISDNISRIFAGFAAGFMGWQILMFLSGFRAMIIAGGVLMFISYLLMKNKAVINQ